MIEAAFGGVAPLSVGVEEELMILDAGSLELAPEVDLLVRSTDGADLPGVLKPELHASIVELATRPARDAAEAGAAMAALRAHAVRTAAEHGLAIAAAGSHPTAIPEQQPIYPDPRYEEFAGYAGATARRQGVCGLHVHVAMPSADDCFRALEWVLPWLPVVLAVSANSPYLAGADTGLASVRAQVLGMLPRAGAPPAFRSYADWERSVERFSRLGIAAEYTSYWWDVRLHPRLGTLEMRAPDQPTALERSTAFVALLQALCALGLRSEARDYDPARRGDYAQNRWAASRFGPAAELIHPDGERALPARELRDELLELVRPAARELGSLDLLAPLAADGCEADRQLAVGRERGLPEVCADLVARTYT